MGIFFTAVLSFFKPSYLLYFKSNFYEILTKFNFLSSVQLQVISSPGQSPGRVIVLPLASALALAVAAALAKSLRLKFFM